MKRKGIKTCCGIVFVLGLLLMIGTAGARDFDQISLRQAVIQSLLGLGMFAGAGCLGGFMR